MPSRTALKTDARIIIKTSKPSILFVSMLFVLLSFTINTLSARVLYGRVTNDDLLRYTQLIQEGNFDFALQYLGTLLPTAPARLVDLALRLVMQIVAAGYTLFLMNSVRRTEPAVANLLDGFGFAVKLIILSFLEGLFITLWSMLFIVPGIIAAYRYRMALYLLIDDPGKSPMQCIRESKQFMAGHKAELFMLDLSFIGWYLLGAITFIGYGVRVWTIPYTNVTRVLYYEHLCHPEFFSAPSGADYVDFN